MTLDEIAATLPWGLHDAYVEGIAIDWPGQALTLTLRLPMSEHQDLDQRAQIAVDGLVFCSIDAPAADSPRGYESTAISGLWIDFGTGAADDDAKARLPPTPDGAFLNWMFVHAWNRFIHICGTRAVLTWLEPAPVAARAATRALFPGDEIPEPT